jgi:lysophospholipid acyltransferase (LPLAT)-like uncharacterized protein
MRRFHGSDGFLMKIVPPLAALLVRLLMMTCRVVKVRGEESGREALTRSGGGAVYTTWHQRMSYFSQYFRSSRITILISSSRDGEYAARIAAWLGFNNVRGSSTRGGTRALREIIRMIREGGKGGFFADGPQGPARVAKMGVIMAAKNAQAPLIPVVWGADRGWTFNSWDRFLVPKPFSRIAVSYAEPLWIPPDAGHEDMEAYRKIVEERLNDCTRWCDLQFGPERPWRKGESEGRPSFA